MSRRIELRFAIPLVLLAGAVIFLAVALQPRQGNAAARDAAESDAAVAVTEEPWLRFSPVGVEPEAGFIFYVGAKVVPEAYAVLMRNIAGQGYVVVVPDMPLNMAVFGWKQAGEIIGAYPEIDNWLIGGHSLGGVMASRYVLDHPGEMDGLVFWASYPAESCDLSERDIDVVSIYGSLDGLASVEEVLASRPYLPPDTLRVELEGGNHAQFGSYGEQPGDRPAEILSEDQQAKVIEATVEQLSRISR